MPLPHHHDDDSQRPRVPTRLPELLALALPVCAPPRLGRKGRRLEIRPRLHRCGPHESARKETGREITRLIGPARGVFATLHSASAGASFKVDGEDGDQTAWDGLVLTPSLRAASEWFEVPLPRLRSAPMPFQGQMLLNAVASRLAFFRQNEMAVVPADVPPLAHLQSLVLHSAFDGAASLHQIQLLGLLIAPALRYLSVSDCDLTHDPIPAIASFLSRSQCMLESMHVTHAIRRRSIYGAAFPSIPRVTAVIRKWDGDEVEDV
ncbi:hypothetical protein B0H11DRAFT_1942009 [Mycena galericulata]|nr:hypothetical protein B0H11DRAFT_1942009 [Mycena galericulata]